MSYGQWTINEELTKKEFGYYSKDLSFGSKKPVKCVCISCGQISNKRFRESKRKHICKSIINNEKKCFKCKKIKNIEEFSKNRSTFDGYQKVCKKCFSEYDSVKNGYKKKSDERKSDIVKYFKDKTSYLKNKSKLKNLDFDLEGNDLYLKYINQNGKCYFSDIDLKINVGCSDFNSISIERLDPNKGYTKNNIVISSNAINSFKGMMCELGFKSFLKEILPNLKKYSEDN